MPRNKLSAIALVLSAAAASVVAVVLIGGIGSPANAEMTQVTTVVNETTIVPPSPSDDPNAQGNAPLGGGPNVQGLDDYMNEYELSTDELKSIVVSLAQQYEKTLRAYSDAQSERYDLTVQLVRRPERDHPPEDLQTLHGDSAYHHGCLGVPLVRQGALSRVRLKRGASLPCHLAARSGASLF